MLLRLRIFFYRIVQLSPALFACICGIVVGLTVASAETRKSLSLLSLYRPSIPTRLYDRNGKVFAELYRHHQVPVFLNEIPPHVIHAFLSVEDEAFFSHIGIDLSGILRALFKNLAARKIVQGGSTLTQQVAKQIYLNAEGRRRRSIVQKIRETLLALQIEENLSKEEILEVFFNIIYLGHGCKGISCASKLYFEKDVANLTLPEAALLARLPRSPLNYSPFKNPKLSRKSHLFALERMADARYIGRDDVQKIHEKFWEEYWPKIIVRSPFQTTAGKRLDEAPYFTDYVRQVLEATPEIQEDALYSGSLNIYTTLDLHHQNVASDEMEKRRKIINRTGRSYALNKGVGGVDFSLFQIIGTLEKILSVPVLQLSTPSIKERLRETIEEEMLDGSQLLFYMSPADSETSSLDYFRQQVSDNYTQLQVQQAFISIEPHTGYITSMIGGAEFYPRNQFNRAIHARRQPGSAFKVFVYGSALEQRVISSYSALNDAPFIRTASDGSSWMPENYDPGFRGLVSARRALASSLNTCAVQLYFQVGPQPIIDLASRLMKINNPQQRFRAEPSLALGSSEVTPLELTTAMAVIANQGREVIPFAIRYVSDPNGNVIYRQEERVNKILAIKSREKTIQIIEPALAHILTKMLGYVTDSGTARHGVRGYGGGGFRGDFASKTGTTSNYSDAWISGFNREYAATVWFGFDKSNITLGPGQSGGGASAPVIGSFFRRIYREKNQLPPSFRPLDQTISHNIVVSRCGGLALGEKELKNGKALSLQEESCAGQRVYDEHDLLIKKLQITPEELNKR